MDRSGSIVRWARIGLVVAAWLYAACVAVQVFLAGLSIFDSAERWSDHVSFGQMIGAVPLVLVILALIGRVSVLTIGLSVAVFFLYGLQYAFANADNVSVAAFHAVNALVMFWIATLIAQQTQRLLFQGRPA